MATPTQSPAQFLMKQDPRAATLRSMLDASKEQLAMALPSHIKVDRLIRVALTSVSKTPALLECNPKSVMASIIESAQLGLMPDGILGEAYLVPYKGVCQLQPGYRGLISLARRSGQVSNIYSELIFKCDKYKVTLGLKKDLQHEPDWENPERGVLDHDTKDFIVPLVGAYAVVIFTDGTVDFEYMPIGLLNQVRATSKAKNENTPWFTNPAEMYRKTPIRRLAKRLPLSPEFQRAAIMDEYVDEGKIIEANESLANASVTFSAAAEASAEHLANKYGKPEDQSQKTESQVGSSAQTSDAPSASAPPEVATASADPTQAEEPSTMVPPPQSSASQESPSQQGSRQAGRSGDKPQGIALDFSGKTTSKRHRDEG